MNDSWADGTDSLAGAVAYSVTGTMNASITTTANNSWAGSVNDFWTDGNQSNDSTVGTVSNSSWAGTMNDSFTGTMNRSLSKVICLNIFNIADPTGIEYFFAAFTPISGIFGAAGNVAIIWVLSDKKFDNYTYTYLLVLAIVQLITLLLHSVYMAALAFIGAHYVLGFITVNIIFPMYSFGTTASLILTVLYNVERFISVRAKTIRFDNEAQQVKARWTSAGVLLAVAILNFPRMLVFDVSDTNPPCLTYRTAITSNAIFGIYTMARFFIFNIGSILILIICNTMLLGFVAKPSLRTEKPSDNNKSQRPSLLSAGEDARKRGLSLASLNRRAAQQRSVTITVISATFLALACEIYLAMFNPITESYTWGKLNIDKSVKRHLRCSTFAAYSIEYSGNIVVYYVLNNKFREALMRKIWTLFGKDYDAGQIRQRASSNISSHDDSSQLQHTDTTKVGESSPPNNK